MEQMTTNRRYATIKQIPELYPAFSLNAIKWLIAQRYKNGFKNCVKKIGKKIIIDLEKFEIYIENRNKLLEDNNE
jgi:hypothetical protein